MVVLKGIQFFKNASIYVSAQYLDKIRLARTKPFPFRVTFLHHDFFKDLNHFCDLDSIHSERKAGYLTATDLRCIRYTPAKQFHPSLTTPMSCKRPFLRVEINPVGMSRDVLKEPQGPHSSSQKIKKGKYQHL